MNLFAVNNSIFELIFITNEVWNVWMQNISRGSWREEWDKGGNLRQAKQKLEKYKLRQIETRPLEKKCQAVHKWLTAGW